MIKQIINIETYWKIIVYYNVNYNLFYIIIDDINSNGTPVEEIGIIKHKLLFGDAKAVTINCIKQNISFVLFIKHKTIEDYISSIVHEAEHVKDAILYKFRVKNIGEPPAYTIGYIVKQMYKVFIKYVIR